MSGDFDVVVADLQHLAGAFDREGAPLEECTSALTALPVPDGGDGAINSALAATHDAIAGLAGALRERVAEHAGKLHYALASYQRHDVDVHGVFEDLMQGMEG